MVALDFAHLKSLGPRKYVRLVALIGQFDREAKRCAKVRAHYAACVLQGAVLEGLLLAMCDGYINEVSNYISSLPKQKRPKGQIVNWSLDSMIKVAIGMNWLPSRKSQRGRRKIGDWVELVNELRNLMHPGKHLRQYPKVRLRKALFSDSFAIVRASTNHLWDKIIKDQGD